MVRTESLLLVRSMIRSIFSRQGACFIGLKELQINVCDHQCLTVCGKECVEICGWGKEGHSFDNISLLVW